MAAEPATTSGAGRATSAVEIRPLGLAHHAILPSRQGDDAAVPRFAWDNL